MKQPFNTQSTATQRTREYGDFGSLWNYMKSLCILPLFAATSLTWAQTDSTKVYTTSRVQGEPPVIDGKLDDPAWDQVEWGGGDFRQANPDKGKPASAQTRFKILYDSKNLYIGFRNFDPEPEKIVRRMSRRDGFDGDWIEINIDSYFDKRTAFSFTSSVSGVKGDEYISDNGDNWDPSWDPIWYLKTSIDAEGWVAELRIPLSQLRFADKEELTWGFQVQRYFFRNQERAVWQYIPPDAPGWVHLFAELRGIRGIKPQKQLEIQPYIVAQTVTFEEEPGNPYRTGRASGADVGLDAKIGITSDITLDLTVNPDFGQVEADPSQVNLTAFELFFEERRPFFIEGRNILNFPVSQMNSNNLFYSRRIGRQPQGWGDPDLSGEDGVDEYSKSNSRTTILAAAKLTGKNKKGFSWGLLESVTAREFAEIDSLGHKRLQTIEPMTNYLVARAQQDINKGNTVAGGMLTATNRKIDDPRLAWLHEAAYSGGFDVLHHWKNRMYYVSARGLFSHVTGTKGSISNTQLSSERYYQREDNHHTEFDPDRTALTGTGGQLVVGKKSGNLTADLGVLWSSPGLELNDIGFLAQTDDIFQWFWMGYRVLQPKGITRWQRYNINQWQEYDFGGRNLDEGYNFNLHEEFKNFWQAGTGFTYVVRSASNADLRGGPSIQYPGYYNLFLYTSTDRRKKLRADIEWDFTIGREQFRQSSSLYTNLTYRPIDALNLSVSPSISYNNNHLQYVATADAEGTPRYVVSEIDQTVGRLVVRATYMLTPNLSIEYYGQPFGASGKYQNYKSITDADAAEYSNRFVAIPTSSLTALGSGFMVDEDNDGINDYGFNRPDFNFGQFRSNMVIRWEYIPGSTLFLVWTQEKNGAFFDEGGPLHKRYSFDFPQKGQNIFLVKFTYRFVL